MHDLRLLTAFVHAAHSGSFTIAARTLNCSPGAISKNIARLERDLGIRLFNRTTRRLSLTDQGAEFCRAVSRSLAELERADDIVASVRDQVEGVVRIALGGAFGKRRILPALARLMDRHPKLDLEIAVTDDSGDLVANAVDLAVRCGAPDDSRYICRRLCSLPLALVASPGYVARRGTLLHPRDIPDHDCINVRHGDTFCNWMFLPVDMPGETAFSLTPTCRLVITEQVEAVIDAAVAGFGATVLDTIAAQPLIEAGALIRLLPEWRVESGIKGGNDLYLVYPHRDYMPMRVRTVVDFLIGEFGSPQDVPHPGGPAVFAPPAMNMVQHSHASCS